MILCLTLQDQILHHFMTKPTYKMFMGSAMDAQDPCLSASSMQCALSC